MKNETTLKQKQAELKRSLDDFIAKGGAVKKLNIKDRSIVYKPNKRERERSW